MKTNPNALQVTERDVTILRFLTRYQFCYLNALVRLVDSTPESLIKRLRLLEKHKLVKRQVLAPKLELWQVCKAGIELSAMNFKERKTDIPFGTISHTVGLANLAAEFEREAPGSKDVIGFGINNAVTVSEREIRQAQMAYRAGRSSAEMRYVVDEAVRNLDAPELERGSEDLFVVYGGGGKTGEHVPDMVVVRPRDEMGKPQHLAIELELSPKNPMDWKRILRSYRDNGGMYSHVIYVTPNESIAKSIAKADLEVGLGEKLIFKRYVPTNKKAPFFG